LKKLGGEARTLRCCLKLFKFPWFSHFARKEHISDVALRQVADQLESGLFEADLGGGVYKKRLARPGRGKSAGYRLIIFFKRDGLTFFVYAYAKSRQENILASDLAAFKKLAGEVLEMTEEQIVAGLEAGRFEEIE